jgi:hypothetical protein
MADKEVKKIAAYREYYAQSGRQHRSKRKLSGDKEESSGKRDKISIDLHDNPSNTTSSSSSTSSLGNTCTSPKMDATELAQAIKKMLEDDFSDMMVRKFKAVCDERIEEKTAVIKTELLEVRAEQGKQKSSIETVENKIDNLEQDKRLNNLMVRGINAGGRNLKQACITTLNQELKVKIKTADINYVIPVGKTEDMMAKLVFSDMTKREEVYAARSKLKGKNLWITEDLTPRKSALFYKTRQCVKEGRAALTWTHNGKIFLKVSSTAKPKLVYTEDDLPKPRPPNTTQDSAKKNG